LNEFCFLGWQKMSFTSATAAKTFFCFCFGYGDQDGWTVRNFRIKSAASRPVGGPHFQVGAARKSTASAHQFTDGIKVTGCGSAYNHVALVTTADGTVAAELDESLRLYRQSDR
jgi:hypothetical protein